MKNLFLIRHAKSSWDDVFLADFERPLNERGHKNAVEMAKRIIERKINVDLMITSPAKRALTTANYFKEILEIEDSKMLVDKNIYEANIFDIDEVLKRVNDEVNNLFLFGHNPTFTYFSNKYSDAQIANIPTCGMVHLTFDAQSWENVLLNPGKLQFFDFPKNKNWKDTLIEK